MRTRDKIILSIFVGLFAMLLYSSPMWWGVLFSPISQPLTTAGLTDAGTGGICWEIDGIVLRFRSLDMLLSFLSSSR